MQFHSTRAFNGRRNFVISPKNLTGHFQSCLQYGHFISQAKWRVRNVEAEKFIESIELKCWDKLQSIAYMPYEEATALVQNLGLKTQMQFRAWRRGQRPDLAKAPEDLPGSPDCSYAGRGWISWGEFFKSGYVWGKYRKWMPFNEAREFARRLGLKSPNEWEAYRVGRLLGKAQRKLARC